jgi:hypothetical protein
MPDTMRDIFICHASEDRDEIVRPMVEALSEAGISCWYDEAEIIWGDSITQKVNDGLAKSRYVVVVFSSAFVQKNWPQRELNAVLNQEASTGEVKVLPLIVGSDQEKGHILAQFPLLNDKRSLPWDGDLRGIVNALLSRLGRDKDILFGPPSASKPSLGLKIPLPKIEKQFSQREKDLFLRSAFAVIKGYFQNALQELGKHYHEVETDFADVHNFKFIATIYLRSEVANKCKIWIGGFMSSDSIAYQAGQFNIDSDNSYNDILSVTDNKQSLGFQPSNAFFGARRYAQGEILTAEQAAEYLWRGFTDNLG